ncbi:MAG: hypothetical protein SaLV2_gp2 [Sanya levivirus 2]|nr:MAG: hypothetical protein SaLV2_gp2 [Sanya levivirus 2]
MGPINGPFSTRLEYPFEKYFKEVCMIYTYLETDPRSGRLTFVGTTDYGSRMSSTTGRQDATNNGVKASMVRGSLVSFKQVQIAGETCGDCTPKGVFTQSVRVEFSAPNPDVAVLAATIRDLADFLEANPRYALGLNLQAAQDITFPLVSGS